MSRGPDKRFNEKILIPVSSDTRDQLEDLLARIPDDCREPAERSRPVTLTGLARFILRDGLNHPARRDALIDRLLNQDEEEEEE